MENQKKLGASAFLPLVVFLALYVGCGITFTLMGVESPFGQFPRHVALLAGIAVALLLAPKVKVSDKLDVFCQNMGNSGVMMIILIYLMAGGFQGAAAAVHQVGTDVPGQAQKTHRLADHNGDHAAHHVENILPPDGCEEDEA